MKPLVLFHSGCWDGFCAAWVSRIALGDIQAIPVQYGQPAPDVKGREVYILDFCYSYEVMANLASASKFLVVLDHHLTNQQTLMDLETMFISQGRLGYARYEADKSGAHMAWDYFALVGDWEGQETPWLVDYTEDRDLWLHQLPNSEAINAALRSYPLDFELWNSFHQRAAAEFISEGQAIRRRETQIVAEHIRHARMDWVGGYRVPVVNGTVLFSEIAGELAKGHPFAAVYFDRSDRKRQWSLRSDTEGVDVSEVAKQCGGGGHKHAAGFEESLK